MRGGEEGSGRKGRSGVPNICLTHISFESLPRVQRQGSQERRGGSVGEGEGEGRRGTIRGKKGDEGRGEG